MSAETTLVRAARREDADAITDVQVAAWRAGYAHVFPPSVLHSDTFDSSRREMWKRWRFGPGHRVAVAELDEHVIGFCSFGPERERARGHTGRGEIWAFYVHPDRWGSGIAAELMSHVEHRLQAEGFATAVLWVLADNPRARRFYERSGWSATGLEATFDDYDVPVLEVEYRKELS